MELIGDCIVTEIIAEIGWNLWRHGAAEKMVAAARAGDCKFQYWIQND